MVHSGGWHDCGSLKSASCSKGRVFRRAQIAKDDTISALVPIVPFTARPGPRCEDWSSLSLDSATPRPRLHEARGGSSLTVAQAHLAGLSVLQALQPPALRSGIGSVGVAAPIVGGQSHAHSRSQSHGEERGGIVGPAKESGSNVEGQASAAASPRRVHAKKINNNAHRVAKTAEARHHGRDKDNSTIGRLDRSNKVASSTAVSDPEVAFEAAVEAERKMKMKVDAKRFEATLSSFQELMNAENTPMPLSEALERLVPLSGGKNFVWERHADWSGGYGANLLIQFQLILWYQNWHSPDVKTRVGTTFSFLHKPGCAYIFQPIVPLTSLMITPRSSYKPMFDMDPRSFHTFKLAWRHYLDFGVSDYRIIVGEQLERWTQRCKAVIDKPLNAVYWLMLMIGSHYRETLVARKVLKRLDSPSERIPVICVDSFVALSALLFSPERQVLYAGTDPTPSYLQWLQYIGDQHSHRKDPKHRRKAATAFEMNEFLDLSVIIVFYGRIQQKVKESTPLSWVGNPTLIKNYIGKYSEDNRCGSQIESAVRLYAYASCMGKLQCEESNDDPWYTWNGLKVCEIGVPMPSTQATFLSPFITTKPIALLCQQHGPDAIIHKEKKQKADRVNVPEGESSSRRGSNTPSYDEYQSEEHKGSGTVRLSASRATNHDDSERAESRGETTSDDDEDTRTDSNESSGAAESHVHGIPSASEESHTEPDEDKKGKAGKAIRNCICARYTKPADSHRKQQPNRRKQPGQAAMDAEIEQALKAVGDYDVLHCFAAILAGGLNLAKRVVRSHFSIDPSAYSNLPTPGRQNWQDGMMPWYRELHRPDTHGRSRYSMLLESTVHGLLGDGFTSGLHEEALDILRVNHDVKDELEGKGAEPNSLKMKVPEQPANGAHNAVSTRRGSFGPRGRAQSGLGAAGLGLAPSEVKDGLSSGASVSGSPALASGSQRHCKGVINDIALWTDLYESESLFNHKAHFETFNQWCHSAQLIPFLQRCYRRCGVAGLIPGQRSGGHKPGVDPSHPLVLPTVSNFCYGHCYPFHRVLEYFYGGMESIVCSCDDPQVVEEDRGQLGLIAGQERLNNQCWFQPSERDIAHMQEQFPYSHVNSLKLSQVLLQQLESYSASDPKSKAGLPLAKAGSIPQTKSSVVDADVATTVGAGSDNESPKSPTQMPTRRSLSRNVKRGTVNSMNQNLLTGIQSRKLTLGTDGKVKKLSPRGVGERRKKMFAARLGRLAPEDPFFWFCQQNFALYAYPATKVPRSLLNEGHGLSFRYSDIVSRSGTPEARRDRIGRNDTDNDYEQEANDEYYNSLYGDGKPVPPSINLCQPTETTDWVRQRWDVKKEFVDDMRLILGDAGWFPGALGHRFTFEVTTVNAERYVWLGSVPQAQLLYIQHLYVPRVDKKREDRGKLKGGHPVFDGSSSSSESDEENLDRHHGVVQKPRRNDQRHEQEHEVSVMLPPILASKYT